MRARRDHDHVHLRRVWSAAVGFAAQTNGNNPDGEVVSTGDNYSDYAFGYDGQGNAVSVDNAGTPGAPHVVLTSQYNAQGERTSLAATISGTADFINSYGYDNLSRLNQITQQGQSGGNAVAAKSIYIGYDNAGDITQLDFSNTTSPGPQQNGPGYATLTYSSTTGQLVGQTFQSDGTTLDNLTYGYDGLGRVSTFSSIDGTATYGYDNNSELVSASYTTATGGHQPGNVSFSWDANGNNDATGVTVSHNEVTNDGTFTYTFDPNGNRTSRTRISNDYASDYKVTYAWDYRNRLTDVEYFDNNGVLTKHVHYVYNVYNDLIEEDIDPTGGGSYTTIEQFALDVQPKLPVQVLSLSGTIDPSAPSDTLLEFVDGALAERFLSGPSPSGQDVIYAEGNVDSLTQPDVVNWDFVNNQGSPTDVVNSSGTLIDHNVFSPFGQVVYVSNTGVFVFQGFSGGIYDPNTGLIKFGERWYDPRTMNWVSADPTGFRAGDPNPSRYIENDPTDNIDPSGLIKPKPTYPYGPGYPPRGKPTRPDTWHPGDPITDPEGWYNFWNNGCLISGPADGSGRSIPGNPPPGLGSGGETSKPAPEPGESPFDLHTKPDNTYDFGCEIRGQGGSGPLMRYREPYWGFGVGGPWTKPTKPDDTIINWGWRY